MNSVDLSEHLFFELADGDVVWPCTVAGHFRLSDGPPEHNVRGAGERDVTEREMIDGVLNKQMASRFRSKSNPARKNAPSHFSLNSPSVTSAFAVVGGVPVKIHSAR